MALRDMLPLRRTHELMNLDPTTAFDELRRDMNELFERWPRALAGFGELPTTPTMRFVPTVDVTETDDRVHVEADLPGMSDRDVEVRLSATADALVLTGEKRIEREEKGRGSYRLERAWGSFERAVALPCEVDANKIEATFKNGVLTVDLAKVAEAKRTGKKIQIKAAN